MKRRLYGITKAWYTNEVNFPFHPTIDMFDGMEVVADADWTEIKLNRPGSLQFQFNVNNGTELCNVSLLMNTFCDIPTKNTFFMAEDANGSIFMIGLGKKYDTIPSVEVNDTISDNANEGCKNTVQVNWKCMCGRIYVKK